MPYILRPTEDDLAYFAKANITDHKLRRRMLMERLVIRTAIQLLISKGYAVKLLDSEHDSLTRVTVSWRLIMENLMACDYEHIVVYSYVDGIPKSRGSIFLVYGNDGYDVMCDLSVWVDEELKEVNKLTDTLAEGAVLEGA